MKHLYFTKKWKYLINLLVLGILFQSSFQLNAQSEPFNCDYSAYLFQYADVYAIDLASGRSYLVAEEVVSGKINAAAYNPVDGYIWGYRTEPSQSIVRIGKDFSTETFTIPELTTGNKYVGAINSVGIYYIRAGSASYYSIDLNPSSENYLKYLGVQTLPHKISVHDWAFNAVDNLLYTVEKKTNKLYRINPKTAEMQDLGEVPILSGLSYTYGAVYFDASGNFYVSANQSGAVYIINEVQNISQGNIRSNIFAYGPASSSNDGARCPTAPVPQEDCSNGIDDDGDGLSDCNDPACSGISDCPVTYAASSANKGGLESNDRLAERISRRNFMRAKDGYTFNTATAKRIKKDASYMKRGTTSKNNISLQALTPLGIIDESEIIESSAEDLLDLTNASDIYSVDYLKDDASIAALMVIKTEYQVYEHSKFICDRFLGAELLSVSTLELREQNFIKSIIKQPNGELEFALTFSARLDIDNQFVIESHWNIDAYKKDALYYNFQIWSSSVDDLLLLGEEVLALLEVNSPIDGYAASAPPPVFVKSARYHNGKVLLNLVNNNDSKQVRMEGGMKRTETSVAENIELSTELNGYLQTVSVDTGNLFDLGFRISAGLGDTPDDLFVADAPWGLDDSSNGTVVETYEVLPTEGPYMGDGYPIERNISLKGTTEDYLGVYRALSPRFSAVDLSDYDKLGFEASGTGVLEVKLLKGNGETFSTEVSLTIVEQEFNLKNNLFKDQDGNETDFSDIKALVFNLVAKNSYAEEKSMDLSNIDFNNKAEVSKFVDADTDKAIINPNPLVTTSTLYFYEDQAGEYTFDLFNLAGRRLNGHHQEGDSFSGQNTITIDRKSLPPGLYFYSLKSSTDKTWSGRLMIK